MDSLENCGRDAVWNPAPACAGIMAIYSSSSTVLWLLICIWFEGRSVHADLNAH
jgi:hypothetical protein